MASFRLRHAFKLPSDDNVDDDEVPVEGIDEQEQEELIKTLEQRDQDLSAFYKNLLAGALGLFLVYYLIMVLTGYGSWFAQVLCLILTMSSAALMGISQDYTLQHLKASFVKSMTSRATGLSGFEEFLVVNSIIIAFTLLLLNEQDRTFAWPAIGSCVVALVGKYTLRPVDVAALKTLRYNYRGA